MKSPVKPRLMRILLDGKPHGEIALATGAGFTKVATIRKWIDLFGHARFIIRKREDGRTGYSCQTELHAGRHWETLQVTLNSVRSVRRSARPHGSARCLPEILMDCPIRFPA